MSFTQGTIYDRKDYDAVLPPRAEYIGVADHPELGKACCEFRSAAASENMGQGETFHIKPQDAEKYYPTRSTFQRRGTLHV